MDSCAEAARARDEFDQLQISFSPSGFLYLIPTLHVRTRPTGPAPITLAHNVASDDEVAEVLARAERAGGTVLKPAQRGEVGFVHGFFADPAGWRWEVAHNPGLVFHEDGTVSFGPIEQPG